MDFPTTEIGGVAISRLIIGSNWFMGCSHYSAAKDKWIKRYQTVERIVSVLEVCSAGGLNAICSSPEPRMREALLSHEERTGRHLYWFITPSGPSLGELLDSIERCAQWGAEFCLPHSSYTDGNLLIAEQRIEGMEEICEKIRSVGMIPGLSTHRPETIVASDAAGYDVEIYIQPYNSLGFLCAVETDWVAWVINQTPKPVMCIKPLAAGRIMPPTGFRFVYNSMKPIDIVCVGLLSPEEASEDIALARSILTGTKETRELQYTQSKAGLVYPRQ